MTNALNRNITVGTLIKFSLPTILTMLFMTAYSMTDGIFVARLINTTALSAVNIVLPLVMISVAIGTMLATGGSAIIGQRMGEGKENEARENFSLIVIVSLIAGIVFAIIGILFVDPIIRFLGANEAVYQYCYDYAFVTLLFAPAAMFGMLFQIFFVTAGKPVFGMWATIIGGVVIGASEMVTNLSQSVITIMFNNILIRMAGENGVAAITIILYVQGLLNSAFMGYSTGIAPLISYNYGKQDHDRLKKTYKISTGMIATSSIVVFALAILLAGPLVAVFSPVGTPVYEMAVHGFRLFSVCFLFMGFSIFGSAMFTALSNGKVSAIISFLRSLVFVVISVLLLPLAFDLNGVWLAIPVAEALGLAVTFYYFNKHKKHYQYG